MKKVLKQPYNKEDLDNFLKKHKEKHIYIENGDIIAEDMQIICVDENLLRREHLDKLVLTPSDVERALYYSDLKMDFEDLKNYIKQKAPDIDIKGLSIEFRANNFYRGAVDKNGNRIVDMIGAILGYSSDDMDYLFENKSLPIKAETENGNSTDT